MAGLVRRHGPMVWGVCRRLLHNHHDAEDAFQATFLVLVRRAASVVPREQVGNWLYGVAYQTALKARATAAKRRARERQVPDLPEPEAAGHDLGRDLRPVLDRELSRLPDKYRVPVVLCDLEGKTYKEAARQLGCPEGTLAARLARARARLAQRLARSGLSLAGGALAAALAQGPAAAGVPAPLAAFTVQAATSVAAGRAAATGLISVRVAALTEGVVNAMLLTRLRTLAAVLLTAALLGGGGGLLTCRTLAEGAAQGKDPDKAPSAGKGDAKPRPEADAKQEKAKLQGAWTVASAEKGGNPHEKILGDQILFTADTFTIKGKGKEIKGNYHLDPTKKPKVIDLHVTEGEGEGQTAEGVYSLSGDELKLCVCEPGAKERPTEFATKEGEKSISVVLKREKR
jgi:RNA polymerase sigma-70 factor (ECF subfamily)